MKGLDSLDPSRSRVFLHTLLVIAGLGFSRLVNIWFLGLIINYYYYNVVIRVNDIKHVKASLLFLFCFSFSPLSPIVPIILRFFSLNEHNLLRDSLKDWVTWVVNSASEGLDSIQPPVSVPLAGLNSLDLPGPIMDWIMATKFEIEELVSELDFKGLIDHKIELKYIRDVGINSSAVDLADREFGKSRETYERSLRYQRIQQLIGSGILAVVGFLCLHNLYVILAIGLYLLTIFLEKHSVGGVIGKKGSPIKNGVYKVVSSCFGFPYSHGVGVCFNNILHVPYHVCGSDRVLLGGQWLGPYYVSIEEDLVTYGGPPQFVRPCIGDEVFVNAENDSSRTTYHSRLDVDSAHNIISWSGVTTPGESGSPVLVRRDGNLHLVGLGGRYVRDECGVITEFAKVPSFARELKEEDSLYERIVKHPGSGKTYKDIPDAVVKFMHKNPGKRILVSGPTRTVCRELWQSLNRIVKTGLNIKGEEMGKDVFAKVQIAAHASALNMCLTGSRELRNLGLIIIDEAHFDDCSTHMLRQYAKYWMDSGVKLIEMSATLDGEIADDSNFPITDNKIGKNDILKILHKNVEEGKKTMVFVSSLSDRHAAEIGRRWKGNVCRLSRRTFDEGIRLVNEPETKIIISTDIGECGINVKDLDCVIDLGEKYDYVMENKVIVAKIRGITKSSQVQRRGRIGRQKEGNYFYVRPPDDVSYETSAKVDAAICLTGRSWGGLRGNPLGIYLSDAQVLRMLELGCPPTLVYLTTDLRGQKLDKYSFMKRLQLLREGDEYYIGCDDNKCNCKGKWQWFDERIHDSVVGTLHPSNVIRM